MSKRRLYVWVLAGWLLLISLLMLNESTQTGRQEKHIPAGSPLKGRHVLASKGCLKCHSLWGADGKQGPDLSYISMGKSLVQIAAMLWSHPASSTQATEAPETPTFTPEEMSELISYLHYTTYINEPGDTAAGGELFSEKGCIKCHSIGSRGGSVGPPLDEFQTATSTLSVAQAMWNHGLSMSATMAEVGVERPRFARKEMANLLAFIHSRTGTKTPDERFLLPGSSLSGQRLFSEKGCVACHSVYGAGGRIGPDLSSKEYSRSVADIAAAMWNHDTLMWLKAGEAKTPRPTFGQGELADIIAFLYSIRSADVPGDASIGKKLFAEKGCAECHESVVLDLSSSDPPGFPAKLAAAMWNHIPTAGRLIRDKNLRWPRFESDEVRDLAAYLTEQPGR